MFHFCIFMYFVIKKCFQLVSQINNKLQNFTCFPDPPVLFTSKNLSADHACSKCRSKEIPYIRRGREQVSQKSDPQQADG